MLYIKSKIELVFLIFFLVNCNLFSQEKIKMDNSIYKFKVQDISGNIFDFSTLKGKKIMIVNTASNCGLTNQYEKLEFLYKKYSSNNFIIVGFPANNFLSQEPGSNEEIAIFCKKNYGVTFPIMSKISVKGNDMHPIYEFLTNKDLNGVINSSVKWNFQKYLINPNGELYLVISPWISPDDNKIVNWINS
tara:strand:+ start:1751 stop:2320 length:570 start_codon:yes stop_codon:yes gene_type:complete